jgi:hypothetical protein
MEGEAEEMDDEGEGGWWRNDSEDGDARVCQLRMDMRQTVLSVRMSTPDVGRPPD